jgi:hypothetical protein
MSIKTLCFVGAVICFFLKGLGVSTGRVDLMNIGFGLVVLGVIV